MPSMAYEKLLINESLLSVNPKSELYKKMAVVMVMVAVA